MLSRRSAIQWVLGAVTAASLPGCTSGEPTSKVPPSQPPAGGPPDAAPIGQGQEDASRLATTRPVAGYGTDPNLVAFHKPGDIWPLTLSPAQKTAATALADVIFPKDNLGPAASEVNVPAMIDEWVSAPYPIQQADRAIILPGLDWIDIEANKRFKKPFADLADDQKTAICDDICDPIKAKKEFKTAAKFFIKFRGVAAGAYYATPPGWEAIGYVGNVALGSFDGPPEEVLKKLGVTQTVV
ncbi:gluconate 2-dehydrogenase subunit 3 family protein [Humisphaera borealis]|uniref:Gluconate 2-dehydrogenase subunit 3 family protein n=2 Tax=Humisphaera borealis TaxID=2807512 RepID=A0A7M2X641_9BACT|nr:gluconate 2-dehydrogenase subunit 3 family protein [Humisphaera borealis]